MVKVGRHVLCKPVGTLLLGCEKGTTHVRFFPHYFLRSDTKIRIESLKNSSCKRFSIRGVRNGSWALLWLSLYALSRSSPAQPQQPSVMQAPEKETPAVPQSLFQGSISGTVIDETGAVIVGAHVRLTSADQSASREALSRDDGQFFFTNVVPGTFQITISASGFAERTFNGILFSGDVYTVPAHPLAPATLTTEIQVTASRIEVAEAQIQAQEKQRVLGVVPNFYVSYVPDAAPLSSKQKFQLAWKTMIDPVTFALTAVTAGVQQSNNDFGGYGQGAQGYAKRFGASYADNAAGTFIGGAILPSILKQDPRYFYSGTGSARSRFLHAIAQSIVCRGDNQRWQPNYSAILGSLASGAISNLYYPEKDRGVDLIFENVLVNTGETAVVNLFQEFVIHHFTTHAPKKQNPSHP